MHGEEYLLSWEEKNLNVAFFFFNFIFYIFYYLFFFFFLSFFSAIVSLFSFITSFRFLCCLKSVNFIIIIIIPAHFHYHTIFPLLFLHRH